MPREPLDIIETESGQLVTTDGEVIEGIHEDIPYAAWAASQLILADEQVEAWQHRRKVMAAILMKYQEGRQAVYDDVAVTIKDRRLTRYDARRVAEGLDLHTQLFEHLSLDAANLLWSVLVGVKGIDMDTVRAEVADRKWAYDEAFVTEFLDWLESASAPVDTGKRSNSWVEIAPVRKLAPTRL